MKEVIIKHIENKIIKSLETLYGYAKSKKIWIFDIEDPPFEQFANYVSEYLPDEHWSYYDLEYLINQIFYRLDKKNIKKLYYDRLWNIIKKEWNIILKNVLL
ncbi:MAG: hypothetical protein PF638_11265 [Candidatus Delongbacteria bacterium]|nr:hypothetical protein [Candidatus Delongbacteria bacterium]